MATPPTVPAGWYADPAGRHEYRYWDGANWTAAVADGGITATDSLQAPPPVQQVAAQPTPAQQFPAQQFPAQPSTAEQFAAQPTPAERFAAQPTPAEPFAAQPAPAERFAAQPSTEEQFATQPAPGQQFPAEPSPARQFPGQPAPVPPLPAQAAPFAAAGSPTAVQRGRRRWAVPTAIAVVVVLGLVVGLVVWAPWRSPPLLRPAGLAAGPVTISSLAFHWSNPATGPDPDRYLILHDGKVIGSVPGTVTVYRTTGLAPDTAYQYRVVAERGGKRSAQSATLVVHTAIPPVSAARWQGTWTVNIKIIKGRSSIHGAKKWTETWLANPKCTTGPCTVRVSAAVNGHNFRVTLTRKGAVYAGKTQTHVFPCGSGSTSFPIKSTLTIRVVLATAQVDNGAWAASSWAGTLDISSPYTASGNFFCPTSHQTASLTGSF